MFSRGDLGAISGEGGEGGGVARPRLAELNPVEVKSRRAFPCSGLVVIMGEAGEESGVKSLRLAEAATEEREALSLALFPGRGRGYEMGVAID